MTGASVEDLSCVVMVMVVVMMVSLVATTTLCRVFDDGRVAARGGSAVPRASGCSRGQRGKG